ncbi:MAG TPA: ABC transporter permease [Phycisphaerales bacterium]|nr:ABC transporter permease [Phycisphaerales bacterium]
MRRVLVISWREFVATVATKGFILGLVLPPIIMGAAITLMPMLMNKQLPKVSGHIAVIDRSGAVHGKLEERYSPGAIAKRREQRAEQMKRAASKVGVSESMMKQSPGGVNLPGAAPAPSLSVRKLPTEADVEEAKQELLKATGKEQDVDQERRLALLVIPPGAVTPTALEGEKPGYEKYDIFVAPRLDIEVQEDIRDQANAAIVDARLESAGLDVARVRSLMARPEAEKKAVTREGERKSSEVAQFLVPGAFMFLLWVSVFSAGQYLLTSTIEEKSSRVMEVILSAVSPLELMTGKIIGKGAVGLLILVLYGGVGMAALAAFALSHLIAWQSLVYFVFFFVIAYFTIAAMMAAIGAAVSEVQEAQSLMAPIMVVLVIPMILWMPILRNPNAQFAQVLSFVPLINPFVMVLRLCGSEPVPAWQPPLAVLVGLLTVVVMVWGAAKIFRIGVLMYGKPPNLKTLLAWVRMA